MIYELSGCGFKSRCSHLNFRYGACFEQVIRNFQASTECRFALKRVRDMIYSNLFFKRKRIQISLVYTNKILVFKNSLLKKTVLKYFVGYKNNEKKLGHCAS